MSLYTRAERVFLEAVSRLAYANPFLPERTEWERAALGADYVPGELVWSRNVQDLDRPRENVYRIASRLEAMMEGLQRRVASKTAASEADLVLYEDAVLHLLYSRYYPRFFEASFGNTAGRPDRWHFYREFRHDWTFLEIGRLPTGHDPVHTFACFRQIQR